LHVGWKDVDERVRRGIEEVFNGSVFFFYYIFFCRWHRAENVFFKRVSLKTKLAAVDLHHLISNVRRTNLLTACYPGLVTSGQSFLVFLNMFLVQVMKTILYESLSLSTRYTSDWI